MNNMNERILSDISKKMNVLISISLKSLVGDKELESKKGRKGVGDSARYLAKSGLDAKDIAEILNAPVSSVRTLLTPGRRK
jgi:hypothetical protein